MKSRRNHSASAAFIVEQYYSYRRWGMMVLDFARVFDALPSPHMVLDRNLNFVSANAEYERVTMRPASDYIGRYVFDMFPNEGESGRRLRQSFDHVLETGETDALAYLPYDIPRPEEQGGGMDRRFWTCYHSPIRGSDGKVDYIVQNTVDVTELVRLTEAASLPFRARFDASHLMERVRGVEQQHQTLLSESDEFRRFFQQAPGFFAILSGPTHVFTFANDAYSRLVGGRDVLGKTVRDALPEIEGQGFLEMLDGVFGSGVPDGGEAVRLMLQRAPGEEPKETFLDFSYDAIRDAEGAIKGIFVQGMDRTEAVRTQQRQRLLLDELNHRVKNTLATVQSIASQTIRSAVDLPTARQAFESRILALSQAHNLLSAQQWTSAPLAAIVEQEASAYDPDSVSAGGPTILLTPKASIAVALVLHELFTNAAKYGALSSPGGKVAIAWRRHPSAKGFAIDWSESGGPPVQPPSRSGFGSRMIERVVQGELDGTFTASYEPGGFGCTIEVAAFAEPVAA